MSNKISNTSFVNKIASELVEFMRYLVGARSKADKKTLRSEMAADKAELSQTISMQKADSDSKISALSKLENNHHKVHTATEQALDENLKDDEITIANGLEKLRAATGAEENGELLFEGTNYLDGAKSLKEALIILDRKIADNI